MILELGIACLCSAPVAPPQRSICTKVIFCGGVLVFGMDLDGTGCPDSYKLIGS